MSNEFLTNQEAAAELGLGTNQLGGDLMRGSQLGVGLNAIAMDAATPLVYPPTTIVVVQTPTMYSNDPYTANMIKQTMESHAQEVSNIDFGYTLEKDDKKAGHDGQSMSVPTKSKRSDVSPSFMFHEVNGNLIWNLYRQWMSDIQDPDTNESFARFGDAAEQWVASAYSLSMFAIQFDPSGIPDRIVDAALYTNMFPTDPGGMIGFQRSIGQSKALDRTVTFTGHVQHNERIRDLGINIAKDLKKQKVNYRRTKPTVSAVHESIADSGIKSEVDSLLKDEATFNTAE